MKKVLTVVLAVLVTMSLLSGALFSVNAAAPIANCSVSVAEYNAGSANRYVGADVTFTSDTPFTAGKFSIVADGLTFTECTVKSSEGGAAPEIDANYDKKIVLFSGFSDSTENDFRSYSKLVISLKFTVDGSDGDYTVRIKNDSLGNVDGVKYNVSDAQATVHISAQTHIPGDINGDGALNNKDLTRLFQYLSDWEVEVNEAALDVNGDGGVNNKDLTRLFQYLSDWDVVIY